MRLQHAWGIASVAAAAVLAAACSAGARPGKGGAPSPTETPAASVAEQDMDALTYFESKKSWSCAPGKEHWRVDGTPIRGGTFKRGSSAITHLDVSLPGGNSQNTPQIYEHLIETRACYYEDTQFVPGLAKSWQVSPDGLTYTLKLRDDVHWHNLPPVNGRKFTSADVAWTIEHQKAKGQLASAWKPIEYSTPDDYTVVLKLPAPNADFLGDVIGERTDYILPHEVAETYGDFKAHAVGTGPYMLKSFAPDKGVIEVRNPDYRENGVDSKPLPYIDGVELPVFSDYTAEVAAMRAGQLDLNTVTGYLKTDADAIMAAHPNFKLYRDVAPIPRGLWMMLDQKPFDDVRIRKAISLAINSDDIIEAGYQGGALRTGFLPTAIVDYAWPPSKVREMFKPDPEQAKQLLAEAGFGPDNPLSFTMKTGQSPQDRAGAQVAQQQLKAVGVDAQIEVIPSAFVATPIRQKDYVVAWGGLSPASSFPNRWMGGLLRCNDSRNVNNLCDPEVDRLSRAQASELDPAKRKALLDQLQQRLYELMPEVPTLSLIYYRMYNCRVQNMPSTEWTQQLTGLARAWLDPSKC